MPDPKRIGRPGVLVAVAVLLLSGGGIAGLLLSGGDDDTLGPVSTADAQSTLATTASPTTVASGTDPRGGQAPSSDKISLPADPQPRWTVEFDANLIRGAAAVGDTVAVGIVKDIPGAEPGRGGIPESVSIIGL